MKIAYFDCFSGVSGDMILGSLVDAGLPLDVLCELVDDLNLKGCRIASKKVKRCGITATKVDVILTSDTHRSPAEMLTLIDSLSLPHDLKKKSKEIFLTLAKAEARVHQEDFQSLHLHELGSADTLVDIVGSLVGLDRMGVEKVYASRVNVGRGVVKTSHGDLPVPAPATLELLKGVPIYSTEVEAELTTPTGAALLKSLSAGFGALPDMIVEKVGYGAGEKELSSPNLLRLLIGEAKTFPQEDWVTVLETNIDDMNPQFYEYIISSLFRKGALDVFLTPTQMKKNRPGILLTVICSEDKEDELIKTIFLETTTLGIRISRKRRRKLKRKIKIFKTSVGEVKVKLGIWDERVVSISPEYDDCKKIAKEKNLPLKKVYELVKKEVSDLFSSSYLNF